MNLLPTKPCPICKEEILPEAIKCRYCGEHIPNTVTPSSGFPNRSSATPVQHFMPATAHTTIIQNQLSNPTNGIGVAGFIIAIVALFLSWIPVVGWLLWLLGLIFSIVGAFRKPKGLAIAGLVISLIGLVVMIIVAGFLAALIAGSASR